MRVAKALAGLHECLSLHEPSLLANAINSRISCAGPLVIVLEYHTLCMLKEKALAVLQECLGSCDPSLLAVDVTLC